MDASLPWPLQLACARVSTSAFAGGTSTGIVGPSALFELFTSMKGNGSLLIPSGPGVVEVLGGYILRADSRSFHRSYGRPVNVNSLVYALQTDTEEGELAEHTTL